VKRLPRSLDDIRGLRAARWIRESTQGQYDRFGPASQREQQDRFIDRHGLIDSGLVFEVAHSGTTVWRSATMTKMIETARAGSFDLLLAGYSDRWQRNLRRTLELLEDGLHPAGVALVMCDRRILSSDPHDWDELVAESTSAERYTRRLAEKVTDGYGAKFEMHSDQGGNAPLGFRRLPYPPHTLAIDPDTIGIAVGLFARYALGNISIERLAAEFNLEPDRVRYLLRNAIFNGRVRRHSGRDEQMCAAPWRANPPVSDELWARVEEVRRSKTQGGGPRRSGHLDLLAGLLECVCGRRLRSDGTFGDGRHRKLHVNPCEAGAQARYGDETWEAPVLAQVAGLTLDDGIIARVVAALSSAERPVGLDRARIERQMRELSGDHLAERIDNSGYLERLGQPRLDLKNVDATPRGDLPAKRAVEWLRVLAETWVEADVPEAKADLLHAIYDRVFVRGPSIVSARLTPAAYSNGLALALPEVVMARPEGFEPPTL
jgi:hypothetical protein